MSKKNRYAALEEAQENANLQEKPNQTNTVKKKKLIEYNSTWDKQISNFVKGESTVSAYIVAAIKEKMKKDKIYKK